MQASSSEFAGGILGVRRRGRLSKLAVLSLSTTVLGLRGSRRAAAQTFSAKCRIAGSVSASGISRTKVSSSEMDRTGRLATEPTKPSRFRYAHLRQAAVEVVAAPSLTGSPVGLRVLPALLMLYYPFSEGT